MCKYVCNTYCWQDFLHHNLLTGIEAMQDIAICCRLRSYLVHQSTCKLHLLLAGFLTQTGENQEEALDQFSKALG